MYRCIEFRHYYPKALARKDFTYSLALKGTPSSSFLESKAGYIIFFCCEESIFAAHESPSLHFLGNPFCETAFITDENCLAESSPVCSHVFSCENSIGGLKSSFRRNKQNTDTELGSEWVEGAVANS